LLAAGIVPNPLIELDDELLLSGRAQRIGDRGIILYKPHWGAFFGTTLDEHLRANNIDTVVVAGCNYPNCPRTSICEASERDFRVVLVEDAVSGLYERVRTEMTNIAVTLCRSGWVVDHFAQKARCDRRSCQRSRNSPGVRGCPSRNSPPSVT
jgi:nicotinamidase-related amidase